MNQRDSKTSIARRVSVALVVGLFLLSPNVVHAATIPLTSPDLAFSATSTGVKYTVTGGQGVLDISGMTVTLNGAVSGAMGNFHLQALIDAVTGAVIGNQAAVSATYNATPYFSSGSFGADAMTAPSANANFKFSSLTGSPAVFSFAFTDSVTGKLIGVNGHFDNAFSLGTTLVQGSPVSVSAQGDIGNVAPLPGSVFGGGGLLASIVAVGFVRRNRRVVA